VPEQPDSGPLTLRGDVARLRGVVGVGFPRLIGASCLLSGLELVQGGGSAFAMTAGGRIRPLTRDPLAAGGFWNPARVDLPLDQLAA